MEKDIVDLILRFDNYLDNMYDRGTFDPTDPTDSELNDFISKMRKKYIKESK